MSAVLHALGGFVPVLGLIVALCGCAVASFAWRGRAAAGGKASASASALAATAVRAAAAAARPPAHAGAYDADVVIVGAGTAGASLAAVLARDGARVVLIERNMSATERIVGELMQPGGIRALERLGLARAAKAAAVDAVPVLGYVCVAPAGADARASASASASASAGAVACQDVVLSYPAADPDSLREQLGWLGGLRAALPASDAPDNNTCPVTGVDFAPRGRSFHNHRFVHELRREALAEPNVTVYVGSVRRLVHAGEARSAGAAHSALRTSVRPPAPFAGYAADGSCLLAAAAGSTAVAVTDEAAIAALSASAPLPDGDAATVAGVAWYDAAGEQHVTTARLTVICDGMFSVLRPKLSAVVPRTVSYFCGLLLKHEVGAPPVPYPQRGHVVMADPSPVLLYQISSTETRLLADVPASVIEGASGGDAAGEDDGAARAAVLRAHFEKTIVPQLPAASRDAVLAALAAQEPVVMPCKQLAASPSKLAGAVLLGDSWNMRHPLTGGGMTVALRDVEALRAALAPRQPGVPPLVDVSAADLQARLAAFAAHRASHASTINILANALHRVFSRPAADDGTRQRLRAACIEYLSLGGPFSAGPVGLLSGLTPRPTVLILHFIAVAVHAVAGALLPLPTPARLRRGYDLLHIACIILMPLLAAERVQGWSAPILLSAIEAVFPWKSAQLD